MQIDFEDKELERLIQYGESKKYKKYSRDKKFLKKLISAYKILCSVENTNEINSVSSVLHYEKLKYNYGGTSSVRIMNGRVERLIFTEHENGIKIILIELDNSHYGNKN